jgi:glycosyltransferase involved in cell wall biosynthesis
MKRIAFAIPGDIDTPTGGYIYDRRIIEGLRALGWQVDLVGLGDGFPFPDVSTISFAQQALAAIPPGCPVLIDGLALGVMPEIARQVAMTHPLIALVHHPLALEAGLSLAQAEVFKRSEMEALSHASHVIVTSPATARTLMAEFGVRAPQTHVVLPGTDRPKDLDIHKTKRDFSKQRIRLLSVGSVTPRKGFDVLMASLALIKDLPWELTIAGDRTRDAHAPVKLDQDIERFGLQDRVRLLGAVSSEILGSLYRDADVFVLASHYEGYGMAFAEALAHGLPVIATTGGAIPETVPLTAGMLVEPGHVEQFAQALRQIVTDATLRATLTQGAIEAAQSQPDWAQSVESFAALLHTEVLQSVLR